MNRIFAHFEIEQIRLKHFRIVVMTGTNRLHFVEGCKLKKLGGHLEGGNLQLYNFLDFEHT